MAVRLRIQPYGPPPGFNPVNGTEDQLACWGFPHRPTDSRGLAAWTMAMQHAIHWVAPRFGAPVPALSTHPLMRTALFHPAGSVLSENDSFNWAGYVARQSDNPISGKQWGEMTSLWTVPRVPIDNSGRAAYAWLGLGGYYSPDIIQAGTSSFNNGTTQFWYENFPDGYIPFTAVPVGSGDQVYVDIFDRGPNQPSATRVYLFYEDSTNGQYSAAYAYDNHPDQTGSCCAEAILEEPDAYQNGVYNPNGYTSYSGMNFTSPDATQWDYPNVTSGTTQPLSGWNTIYIRIDKSDGTPIADPSTFGSNGDFSVPYIGP